MLRRRATRKDTQNGDTERKRIGREVLHQPPPRTPVVTGRTSAEECAAAWYTVLSAVRGLIVDAPGSSPVFGLTSNLGALLELMCTAIRCPASKVIDRLQRSNTIKVAFPGVIMRTSPGLRP